MTEPGLIGPFGAITPWLLGSIGLVDVAAAMLSLAQPQVLHAGSYHLPQIIVRANCSLPLSA
jgi:hypothetical protein